MNKITLKDIENALKDPNMTLTELAFLHVKYCIQQKAIADEKKQQQVKQ